MCSTPTRDRVGERAPDGERHRLALRLDRSVLRVLDCALRRPVGLLAHEDPARRRRRLDSRRRVDHVTRDHPFARVGSRREVDERLAGVDADPDFQVESRIGLVELGDRVLDRECGSHSPLGVVLVHDGRAEDRDHRVADELLDGAAEALQLVSHARVVRREDRPHVLGVERFRTRGRPDDVGEHHGDDLPLLVSRLGDRARAAHRSPRRSARRRCPRARTGNRSACGGV